MLIQWPPTIPGVNFIKFHLVAAAAITSFVLMPIEVYNWCISFISAIFTSLWIFSVTFAASATLIDDAWWIPASIIEEYKNVTQLRFGGEYLFPITSTFGCVIRFGIAYIPTAKTSGSEDQAITSFGLGIPIYDRIILDMAYMFSYQKKKTSDSYVPSYVDEEINKNQFLFNLSYLF